MAVRHSKPFTVGDYHCTGRLLGEGAYANVYEGYHKYTNERVAIKAMNMPMLRKMSPQVDVHLAREVNIMSCAHDENIVRLYAKVWNRARTYLYLVMEFCDQGDLSGFLQPHRGKGIPEELAQSFMRQFAGGLLHLRGLNVVHRDLKPQNLLMREIGGDLSVKIADFGFARVLHEHDLSLTHVGSPVYMAPEILEYKRYTVKTDLWSVGVIMYEMLYGCFPIPAKTVEELQQKIRKLSTGEVKIVLPREKPISAQCRDLLVRLLQYDANARISWTHFFQHPWLGLNQASPLLPEFSSAATYATHGRHTAADNVENTPRNDGAAPSHGGGTGVAHTPPKAETAPAPAPAPAAGTGTETAAKATPEEARARPSGPKEAQGGDAQAAGDPKAPAESSSSPAAEKKRGAEEAEKGGAATTTGTRAADGAEGGGGSNAAAPATGWSTAMQKGAEKASVAVPALPPLSPGSVSLDSAGLYSVKQHFAAAVAISQLAYMKARVGGEGEALALHLEGLRILKLVAEALRAFKSSPDSSLVASLQDVDDRVRGMFSSELGTVRHLQRELRVNPAGNVSQMIFEHALELVRGLVRCY
eukprot:TRINITY_DN236_c0_g1_i1.p1 TRINITY_DN236_c0_g1~~TRINITY_DN236_c0_g1_i1.p1  ORF type:complete len:587 (+),score=169.14 TRINITY_DN236_c0_g1_i1:303-2063(+)